MDRRHVLFGQPLEKQIGFSRATRIGPIVAVTGTAPLNPDGSTCSPGSVYLQARRCLEIISEVLDRAGARIEDVIRTRVLLTDIETWQEAAKAHGEYFAEIRPATTFVEVSRFINPEWLIEIEADAVVRTSDPPA